MRLHAARGIHRIAPHVVDEFVRPDHARNDRAGVNSYPRLQLKACLVGNDINHLQHARGKRHDAKDVVGLRPGNAGRHHVGVADGLYLFHPVFEGKAIESGEYAAQERDGAVGRQFLTERGKPDEVAKQDCCVDDSIGNDLFAIPHAIDHDLRQDVEQQRLGPLAFLFQVLDEFPLAVT